MNNEMGIIPAFAWKIEDNHEKPVRIAGLWVEIWTWDIPNTKQEC
jgi:hypothetical protein